MGSPDDIGSAGSWPCVLQVVEGAGEQDRIAPSKTNIKVQCSFRKTHGREQREKTVIKRKEENI